MAVVSCEIVSANESIFTGSVKMLVVTGSAGELGIMPGHAALLSDLKPGPVRIVKEDDSEEVYYLSGGYVEVQPNSIAVLADTAIRADSIDEASAAEAVKDAESAVKERYGHQTCNDIQRHYPGKQKPIPHETIEDFMNCKSLKMYQKH